jgi:GNAT superfamily N-acetyltransferase
MNIAGFTHGHIDEAYKIVKDNYEEERKFVPILPKINEFPDLKHFADNNLGVVAFENGKMIGFLCCYNACSNAFGTTNVKGTFSPCHAHGAVGDRKSVIYSKLYQVAAEKWLKSGILSHSIALYAHDKKVINSFFINGFGLRCIDAIRLMEEFECEALSEYTFYELEKDKLSDVEVLNNLLILHLSKSPIFMKHSEIDKQSFQEQLEKDRSRIFVATKENVIIAYVKVDDEAETFVSSCNNVKNICGAFCLPEYRGKGIYQNLLNFLITKLKKEGYSHLGVDFESFNPTAYGFWKKYFNIYTNGIVRRIDDLII